MTHGVRTVLREFRNQIAVINGYRNGFSVEPPPVGSREIDKVLQICGPLALRQIVRRPPERDVRRPGNPPIHNLAARLKTIEPDKIAALFEDDEVPFVGNQAVRVRLPEKLVLGINLQNRESHFGQALLRYC